MGTLSDRIDAAIEELVDISSKVALIEDGSPPPPPPPPPPPVGDLVIPATLAYNPSPSFKESESFNIMTSNKDTGTAWFEADYIGHGMPYLYPEAIPGNHDHAWWVPGDRQAYAVAYGFLYDKHPAPFGHSVSRQPGEGVFIARFTISRIAGAGYAKVNDRYMNEAERYWDGRRFTGSTNEIQDEDASVVSASDFEYEPFEGPGDTNIRVGLFRGDGAIGDIRDFNGLTVYSSDIKFRVVPEITVAPDGNQRVAVVMYERDLPGIVFYYDTMNSGRIAVEVNGVMTRG